MVLQGKKRSKYQWEFPFEFSFFSGNPQSVGEQDNTLMAVYAAKDGIKDLKFMPEQGNSGKTNFVLLIYLTAAFLEIESLDETFITIMKMEMETPRYMLRFHL